MIFWILESRCGDKDIPSPSCRGRTRLGICHEGKLKNILVKPPHLCHKLDCQTWVTRQTGRSDGNYGHRLPTKSCSKWREPTVRLSFAKGYRYSGLEMGDANNSTETLVDGGE